jgi:hypothetical protein
MTSLDRTGAPSLQPGRVIVLRLQLHELGAIEGGSTAPVVARGAPRPVIEDKHLRYRHVMNRVPSRVAAGIRVAPTEYRVRHCALLLHRPKNRTPFAAAPDLHAMAGHR